MICPICKRPASAAKENRYRPFCSERCQMIDLGTWAAGGYRLADGKDDDREHPDDRDPKKLKH